MRDTTFDKVVFIESDAVPKENADIKPHGTSISITHSCGCLLTEHFTEMRPLREYTIDNREYNLIVADRKYFVNFCPEHEATFKSRINEVEIFPTIKYQVLRLLKKATLSEEHSDYMGVFELLTTPIRNLPDTSPVVNTFKGILGYYFWTLDNHCPLSSFIQDAIYDLNECVANHAQQWYTPRTENYIEFYDPDRKVSYWDK